VLSPTGLIPWFSKLREILTLLCCITLSSSREKPTQAQEVAGRISGAVVRDDMQNPKIGDASLARSTTCCNDHDWGDFYYDLENLFKPHDDYVCDNIESGFGRVSTLGNNDPTTLEYDQSYEIFDKSGLGEVMTLFDNPTILEECQLCMHVDHEKNILCDSYIVEFDYDPTCNYYERGKYGRRNFHVTKLPLVMSRLLLFLSSSLHMLDLACLANLFSYKMPMHRKYVRLRCVFTYFVMLSLCFKILSFM
jgi:hypothetical protein